MLSTHTVATKISRKTCSKGEKLKFQVFRNVGLTDLTVTEFYRYIKPLNESLALCRNLIGTILLFFVFLIVEIF